MCFTKGEIVMKKNKLKKALYLRSLAIIAVSILLSIYVFMSNNQMEESTDGHRVLRRSDKGSKTEQLLVEVGEEKQSIHVRVSSLRNTDKEIEATLNYAIQNLETLIIGDNESLNNVRYDLDLISQIPNTDIRVKWLIDSYEYIDSKGRLREETLSDEGSIIELAAVLTIEDVEVIHEMYAHLYPREYSTFEIQMIGLEEKLNDIDETTRQDQYLILPSHINDQPISWHTPTSYDFIGILFLGVIAASLLLFLEKQKEKEAWKKRKTQMLLDYPKVVGTFALYLEAGMTPRNAWFKMAEAYLSQREDIRHAYEEMLVTMYEIKGGKTEAGCYESFGNRCDNIYYRKFGGIIAGNIKKGTKGMVGLLKAQVELAREERKNTAKRLGEEAGTKLLLPMFIMLGIVLAIIIIPAFLSIQV